MNRNRIKRTVAFQFCHFKLYDKEAGKVLDESFKLVTPSHDGEHIEKKIRKMYENSERFTFLELISFEPSTEKYSMSLAKFMAYADKEE